MYCRLGYRVAERKQKASKRACFVLLTATSSTTRRRDLSLGDHNPIWVSVCFADVNLDMLVIESFKELLTIPILFALLIPNAFPLSRKSARIHHKVKNPTSMVENPTYFIRNPLLQLPLQNSMQKPSLRITMEQTNHALPLLNRGKRLMMREFASK